MQEEQIISPRNLPAIVGLSKTTIWRLERTQNFPKRIRLSAGRVGYRLQEVVAWIETRQAV